MPASYPTAPKTFTARSAGQTIASAHINDLQDEVNAIETGLLSGGAPVSASNATFHALNVTAGSTLASLSVTGPSTLASTMTIGTLPYVFPAAGGSSGQALVISSTNGSTMTLAWQTIQPGNVTLLKANNGTDASAGATNVDTVPISGLTANDMVVVKLYALASSQATANIGLHHQTDGITLLNAVNPLAAGATLMLNFDLTQIQSASTGVATRSEGKDSVPTAYGGLNIASLTTAWTAPWTLALRHGGVTAGGTFRWKWIVQKVAGQ